MVLGSGILATRKPTSSPSFDGTPKSRYDAARSKESTRSALALVTMSRLTSYMPMLYTYPTEPTESGLPVVSATLPGLPIVTKSMLNWLGPDPKETVTSARTVAQGKKSMNHAILEAEPRKRPGNN